MKKYKSVFKENYGSKVDQIINLFDELSMEICGNQEDAGKVISRSLIKKMQSSAPVGSAQSEIYFACVRDALESLETHIKSLK